MVGHILLNEEEHVCLSAGRSGGETGAVWENDRNTTAHDHLLFSTLICIEAWPHLPWTHQPPWTLTVISLFASARLSRFLFHENVRDLIMAASGENRPPLWNPGRLLMFHSQCHALILPL